MVISELYARGKYLPVGVLADCAAGLFVMTRIKFSCPEFPFSPAKCMRGFILVFLLNFHVSILTFLIGQNELVF